MMMGAMVMAKPSLAGGLPGAMAPPEGMTAEAMGSIIKGDAPSGEMITLCKFAPVGVDVHSQPTKLENLPGM